MGLKRQLELSVNKSEISNYVSSDLQRGKILINQNNGMSFLKEFPLPFYFALIANPPFNIGVRLILAHMKVEALDYIDMNPEVLFPEEILKTEKNLRYSNAFTYSLFISEAKDIQDLEKKAQATIYPIESFSS